MWERWSKSRNYITEIRTFEIWEYMLANFDVTLLVSELKDLGNNAHTPTEKNHISQSLKTFQR